jgi:lipid A 3-O-deacylase
MLAGALAVGAYVLAGAGRAGGGLVAGILGGIAHIPPTTGLAAGSPAGTGGLADRLFRPMKILLAAAAAATAISAPPAAAQEAFGGLYAHDVDTGLTRSGVEDGVDLELGWRGERMRFLSAVGSPAPHVYVSLNSAGDTHFASAGIDWKVGGTVYVRPGIGLAVHTGSDGQFQRPDRIAFGSRLLFAPELGLGVRIDEAVSVEASWVHLSHAQLFSRQNPGLDTIGLRINYRFR